MKRPLRMGGTSGWEAPQDGRHLARGGIPSFGTLTHVAAEWKAKLLFGNQCNVRVCSSGRWRYLLTIT